MFKAMASKSAAVLAREYGLDKVYATIESAKSKVSSIRKEVAANPEKFKEYGVSQEVVDVVNTALASRLATRPLPAVTAHDKETVLETMEYKPLLERGAKKSLVLLNKQLDYASKSKKALSKIPIGTLATVTAILFDKTRLSRGEATEHIMMKAKITEDLTPTQRLELILSMREQVYDAGNTNASSRESG